MTCDRSKPHRRALRLARYNYTQCGLYFVTIWTHNRECTLGDIAGEEFVATDLGRIVAEAWGWLANNFPAIVLDESVVMPNYVHGILAIGGPRHDGEGGSRTAPTTMGPPEPHPFGLPVMQTAPTTGGSADRVLGRYVGAFKTVSAKRINQQRGTPGQTFWQRGYYDHVIRNDADLDRVRRYISENPGRWSLDREVEPEP